MKALKTYDVILKPVLTERATSLNDRYGKIVLKVAKDATKYQIRAAVEAIYGVTVTQVHTLRMPGKPKRRGTQYVKMPSWKKAIVSLKKGDKVDFFATE